MASNHCSLRLLEQSRVSPTPGSVVHSASLLLTFFDIIWLYLPPVERLFLYDFPHPTAVFMESYLPNLKSSLSLTLQHFYPLAGKLRLSPDSTEQFELHYVEGDSVSLTVAESDLDFADLVGSHARESDKIRSLVPQLPESDDDAKSLLAIQLTVFPNFGIGIGFIVHHVACDGLNTLRFINSWASSCRSNGQVPVVEPAPFFDRLVIIDPCNLYSEYIRDMRSIAANNLVHPSDAGPSTPADLVTASFTLGPYQIEVLKMWVQLKSVERNVRFSCSTFVVCCAHVWVCHVKSQRLPADGKAYYLFTADWRKRLRPPTPDSYFGNCIGACFAEANTSDLIREDGVVAAAEAIASAIERLKEGVSKNMVGLMPKIQHMITAKALSVAGSPKFKVYDIDFGWGMPQKIEVPSIQRNGAIWLAESRDGQGVEVGLALQKHEMEAVTIHFEKGLKLIQEDICILQNIGTRG